MRKEYSFKGGRRITPQEVERYSKALDAKLGADRPKRGRPLKSQDEKSVAISIRLSALALAWAKLQAEKNGVGYQTFINEQLEQLAAADSKAKAASKR